MAAIAELIENLASLDAQTRASASRELYRAGAELAENVIRHWRRDPELALLLCDAPPIVGIAVRPDKFVRIRRVMGSPALAEVPPDQDAREFEVRLGGVSLDILTVRSPDGPPGAVSRFLEKFGEGIQQVEYLVSDVDSATEILRSRFGLPSIFPAARSGANNTRVNFFLPGTLDGKRVLIELVESPPEDDAA
jgi:methylmalonyl-CoA/ethylmalonyl-CoA epimerase